PENANHPRALAATVTLHLHLDRIELCELGAGFGFAVESEHGALRIADVAPDSVAGFDFDLEFRRWLRGHEPPQLRDCNARIRSSIGGWVAKSAMMPALSVIPNAASDMGH